MMSFINTSLVSYVLKASIRDKLILALIIVFLIALSLSVFIGGTATTETGAAILTFSASSARFIGTLSLILFVVFYLRRAFDTHDIEYLLSRPVSRISFILSHFMAFTILSGIFSVVIMAGFSFVSASFINVQGLFLWSLSLCFEFMIVSYAAFFFAMVLPSAVTATMATIAGYALARMIGQILGIIDAGGFGQIYVLLSKVMEASSVIVPRFDLMTQSSWLIFGPDSNIGFGFILIHGCLFLLLITCASIFDLLRKEF